VSRLEAKTRPTILFRAAATHRILFFGRGFPKKNTGLPLAGPDQARGLSLSPSRSTACRRDPRRCRTQHPSCYLRQAPRHHQTHWRVTSNWPPSPCPLHGATRPLPTPVEHISDFSLPSTKEDLRLRPPHRSPAALPHVEHLHPDCRLAVFDEMPIRQLIRPSFRVSPC
jgi:hypothetical protein